MPATSEPNHPERPGPVTRRPATRRLAAALLSAGCLAAALGSAPRPAHADVEDFFKKLGDKVESLGDGIADKVFKRTEDAVDGRIDPDEETTVPSATAPKAQPMSAGPAPAAEPAFNHDRVIVRDIQRMLNEMGYDAGPVDGAYGRRTAGALGAFQRDHGLPPSGDITAPTLAAVSDAWRSGASVPRSAQSQQAHQPVPSGAPRIGQVGGNGAVDASAAPPDGKEFVAPATAGGMVAPALAGAPVDSPAEAPTQAVAADAAPAAAGDGFFPSPAAPIPSGSPYAGGLDPLRPAGVSLGMTVSDAAAALKANGYQQRGPMSFAAANGQASRDIWFQTGRGPNRHEPTAPITFIHYTQFDPGSDLLGIEFINRMTERIGGQPACQIVRDVLAVCDWVSPPSAPLVQQIGLTFEFNAATSGSEIVLQLSAVDDMEAAAPSPSAEAGGVGAGPAADLDPSAGGVSSPTAPARTGGLVAPAPAGGLIAPAPGGGQISPSGSSAEAQALAGAPSATGARPPFDPLAPGGVSIGMTGPDAVVALEANGYEQDGGCEFRIRDRGIHIELSMGEDYTCSGARPVSAIGYIQRPNDMSDSPRDIVRRTNERLGAEAECAILDDKLADCEWGWTPGAPLIKGLHLLWSGLGQRVQVYVTAVDDLESRLQSSLPKVGVAKADKDRPGGFDPLAPGGTAIGMEMSATEAALKANGFRRLTPGDCDFHSVAQYDEGIRIFTERWGCKPGKPVRVVQYRQMGKPVEGSLLDFVDRMNERLGAVGTCKERNEHKVSCYWDAPSGAPLLESVTLDASKTYMSIELFAVRDLESRVVMPAPQPTPLEAQPWWVQEIARAEAEAEGDKGKFARSERFEQLPSAMQAQLGAEGSYVYDYCKGRGTFARFHDCRCVASKLVEVRIDEEGRPLDRNEHEAGMALIGKADRVADACPNKAGAASYAYEGCMGIYGASMIDGVKEYCTCYADVFATAYMNNPNSYMPHITKLGVFAYQECERQGYPSPRTQ